MADIDVQKLYAEVAKGIDTPSYMQLTLNDLRLMTNSHPPVRDDVKKFLVDTASVSGRAIVALTIDSITLLVDDDGNLLEFA